MLAMAGCGTADPARNTLVAVESPSAEQDQPGSTAGPTPGLTVERQRPAPSNERSLRRGLRIAHAVGIRSAGEAEPPHGDVDADLGGRWRGHEVLFGVLPLPGPPGTDRRTDSTVEIGGVLVDVNHTKYVTYYGFALGDYRYTVGDVDAARDPRNTGSHTALGRALTTRIICHLNRS